MFDLVIRVQCPHCGKEQNTRSLKRVICQQCGKAYKIYPKDKKSRVVKIVKGSEKLLHSELYRKGVFRQRKM